MPITNFSLHGRCVLVTGASSGLGLHFSETLARAGATVVMAARRIEQLAKIQAALQSQGLTVYIVQMDVTNEASISAAFTKAQLLVDQPIDLLVNNAGVASGGQSHELSSTHWDDVVDTNLKGPWLVSREFAKRLIAVQHNGVVIHIGSILGSRVAQSVSAYCASKAGLHQLTKAQALEWSRHSLRVNALSPGYIETDLNRDFFMTDAGKRLIKRMPAGRLGKPEELDGALLLLASDAGSFINGTIISVDGGHLASSL